MAVLRAEVRAAIVEDLKAGKSQNATARKHKVSPATVNGIAKAECIPANIQPPKNAAEAKRTFDHGRRIALNDKLFGLIDEWADGVPHEVIADAEELKWANRLTMKDMITSYAILVDKRRLEEGESTERHEQINRDAQQDALRRGRDRLRILDTGT